MACPPTESAFTQGLGLFDSPSRGELMLSAELEKNIKR